MMADSQETNKQPDSPFRIALGIDIVEIQRIGNVIDKWGNRFLERCFTPSEIQSCHGSVASFAARFAAKEAAVKALGTGLRGMDWLDIEVYSIHSGAPQLTLHNGALQQSVCQGWQSVSLSLTHSAGVAAAVVAAICCKGYAD